MSEAALRFTAADSVLVFAPHPDDETLAAGGLLQRAARAGARLRVAFATEGENNPWPQRVIERRWTIDERGRRRFGALRRSEAASALRALGLVHCALSHLELPDQGITGLSLTDARPALALIRRELTASRPTLVVAPSPRDHHPDHSAFGLLVLEAVGDRRPIGDLRLLHYRVHGGFAAAPDVPPLVLRLTPEEQARKLGAICAYRSQLVFRRRFFRSFASELERFETRATPAPADATHPVKWASAGESGLELRIRSWPLAGPLYRKRLLVRGWGPAGASLALSLPAAGSVVRLPPSCLRGVSQLFVKLERRWGFFDGDGWREICVSPGAGAGGVASRTKEGEAGGRTPRLTATLQRPPESLSR